MHMLHRTTPRGGNVACKLQAQYRPDILFFTARQRSLLYADRCISSDRFRPSDPVTVRHCPV